MNSIDTFDNMEHNDHTRKNYFGGDETMGQPTLKDRISGQAEGGWVTTGQAKKLLGVSSVNTVKRWAAEGKLDAQKVGANNWMRISVNSIERLLQSGNEHVQAFQKLKQRMDGIVDLDVDVTEEDLQEMSDHQMGKLPRGKQQPLDVTTVLSN